MRIILFFLFLEFIYCYYNYGQLKKYSYLTIYDNDMVYIDLDDFKDEKYLYFKITIHYGYFYDHYLHYGYSSSGSLPYTQDYYSETYGSRSSYYSYYYYDYYTYRYQLEKPSSSNRYLYIAPSRVYSGYTGYYIEIENVSGFGLSVAVIIIIVIACVAIAAASIVVYFCRRARRASYIAPPVAEYQPPVATVTAYPPPTYY